MKAHDLQGGGRGEEVEHGERKGIFMTLLHNQSTLCLDLSNSQRCTLWKQSLPKYMK